MYINHIFLKLAIFYSVIQCLEYPFDVLYNYLSLYKVYNTQNLTLSPKH